MCATFKVHKSHFMKSIRFIAAALAAVCTIATSSSRAQMTAGSVFLKGRYVEAGICANGDFGAATPPAGYHPHTSSSGGGSLGFVADPAMDGWATGTPAYVGDYFVPGTPFEGWNLQIGGVRAQAQSCMGFTGTGLTGANTAYAVSGSKVIGTWEGTFDSMTVRQVTTLDTNARCLVYNSWPISFSVDLYTIYGMSYATCSSLYAAGATNTADVAIGLVFRIPHLFSVFSVPAA